MRVLQVEDNMTTAKSVELMLKAQGHACETAKSGQEALRLVEEKDYDLILLDIMLPDIDGYEFLKRIGMPAAVDLGAVVEAWSEVAGEPFAASGRPVTATAPTCT